MSVASKLVALANAKAAIKSAITGKGGNLTGVPFSAWDAVVSSLASGVEARAAWTKPSDWLSLPSVVNTEQKVALLCAIHNNDGNYVAFTAAGAGIVVDWGDGTAPESFADGVPAQHLYVWSNVSSSTLTSRGYRQAVITVTVPSGNVTSFNLASRHTALAVGNAYSATFLDVALSLPSASTVTLGSNTNSFPFCERIRIIKSAATSWFNAFSYQTALQSVEVNVTSACTSFQLMFNGASQVRTVSIGGDTSGLTSVANMFASAVVLQTAPSFSMPNVTDVSNMYNGCVLLSSVPAYDLPKVTTMANMFNGCASLETTPVFTNTSLVTTVSNLFAACRALKAPGLFDTSNVTNFTSMFQNCSSLVEPPLFNTIKGTNFTTMFSGCTRLEAVPLFNMVAATSVFSMFINCRLLKTVPLFVFPALRSANQMFDSCYSLTKLPALDTSAFTDMGSIISNIYSITEINLNCTANTTGSLIYTNAYSCGKVILTGNSQNVSVTGLKLSAAALNALFTSLASGVSGKSVNITGTPGAATCDRTIATAKGWTVTG